MGTGAADTTGQQEVATWPIEAFWAGQRLKEGTAAWNFLPISPAQHPDLALCMTLVTRPPQPIPRLPQACGGRGWFISLGPVHSSTGSQEAGGGGQPGRKPEVSGHSPEQLAVPSFDSMWALALLWPVVLGFSLEDDSQNTLTYDEMGSAGGDNGE